MTEAVKLRMSCSWPAVSQDATHARRTMPITPPRSWARQQCARQALVGLTAPCCERVPSSRNHMHKKQGPQTLARNWASARRRELQKRSLRRGGGERHNLQVHGCVCVGVGEARPLGRSIERLRRQCRPKGAEVRTGVAAGTARAQALGPKMAASIELLPGARDQHCRHHVTLLHNSPQHNPSHQRTCT